MLLGAAPPVPRSDPLQTNNVIHHSTWPINDPFALVVESALAARWGKSLRTMQRWRKLGYGPPHLQIGGSVVYRVGDIQAFEDRQRGGGEVVR